MSFMSSKFDENEYLSLGIKFLDHIGIRIFPSDNKHNASGIIKLEEYHSQIYDRVHGGVLYSLADTVAGHCAWNNIDPTHDMVITLEMKMNYIASCPVDGYAKAIGNLKHIGKRTAVIQVDVFHITNSEAKEKLIATSIATFQILKNLR